MLRVSMFVVPLALAICISAVRAEEENPVVTTVKSKLKEHDKPFGMSVIFKVKSAHVANLIKKIDPLLDGAPTVKVYAVAGE